MNELKITCVNWFMQERDYVALLPRKNTNKINNQGDERVDN